MIQTFRPKNCKICNFKSSFFNNSNFCMMWYYLITELVKICFCILNDNGITHSLLNNDSRITITNKLAINNEIGMIIRSENYCFIL